MSADRGKELEDDFKDECKKEEKQASFAHHRFPDAKAGSFKTAPADFMTNKLGVLRLIECKEVKVDGRLPYANFKPDQVARMRLWKLSGAKAKVLIHQTTCNIYTVIDVDYFVSRPAGQASWFFKDMPHENFKTLREAFDFIHS